jgi:hypothetical protein
MPRGLGLSAGGAGNTGINYWNAEAYFSLKPLNNVGKLYINIYLITGFPSNGKMKFPEYLKNLYHEKNRQVNGQK